MQPEKLESLFDLLSTGGSRGRSKDRRRDRFAFTGLEQLEDRLLMSAEPTAAEQLLFEYTNRTRMFPELELATMIDQIDPIHSADPDINAAIQFFEVDGPTLASQMATLVAVPPLAWNANLDDAAEYHNGWMIQEDDQSHWFEQEGELDLGDRADDNGYTQWNRLRENIYAYSESVFYGHAGFVIDWGPNPPTGIQDPAGHRINIMSDDVREVGISIALDPPGGVGPMIITQDFGNRPGMGNPFLLGVLYDDMDNDDFYSEGEGKGGVNVTATENGGAVFNTTTWGSGGYQMQLPAGTYTVMFDGSGIDGVITVENVVVGGDNVKVDATADQAVLLQPDLIAIAFDALTDHVLLGQTDVTVTIRNQGDGDAGAFTIDVYYSDDATVNTSDTLVTTFGIASLASGDSTNRQVSLQLPVDVLNTRALADDLPGLGTGHVSTSFDYVGIIVDAASTVDESDESNNDGQGKGVDSDDITYFPWDVDGGGTVTATDAIFSINRLGQDVPPADARADFNGSGAVTATDAIAAINRLGYLRNDSVIEVASAQAPGSTSVSFVQAQSFTPYSVTMWMFESVWTVRPFEVFDADDEEN